MTNDPRFQALDGLPTEELRQRAFSTARHHGDIRFFVDLLRHLPAASDTERLDNSTGDIGLAVDDAVALWREFTGHGLGDAEPVLRASFIDYLLKHEAVEH
ncbi:hypothetical protein GCM10009765_62680 [Fodinicola feengrottensis]|uniref:Uncharacterized protein n=1 Tax=Fodinicola feengrottensis TaxID=435914 RepID=A0ABP4UG04_9ACTN